MDDNAQCRNAPLNIQPSENKPFKDFYLDDLFWKFGYLTTRKRLIF